MGRKQIWSDWHIQRLTDKFVCVIDNVFYLNPPAIIKPFHQPDSTRIFDVFMDSAPDGVWPTGSKTQQGLYVLAPEGKFLSGGFSYQTKHSAKRILEQGWQEWSKIVEGPSKPVPSELMPVVDGRPVSEQYAKLQVTYRDLPRGWNKRPGDRQFDNPYNLGWYDLSQRDLKKLVMSNNYYVLKKLSLATMKDAVRGEMIDWRQSDWVGGDIDSQRLYKEGSISYYYLKGWAEMNRTDQSLGYNAKLYGKAAYDHESGRFVDFQLIASGQRTGAGPFNGRKSDKGIAPMGVAIRMQ